jgi:flavin reductase (DIM6/NTAB) family NADH-FMN oxidoreductase RutF
MMDADAKKTALRMIPYGLYVLTTTNSGGEIATATVNWVTQTSFAPPLVAVGVKTDSNAYAVLKESGSFALNMLGKGQQGLAFAFFKPAEVGDGTLSGQPYRAGSTGSPVLTELPACVECKVAEIVEQGDHHIVVGEVVDVHVMQEPEGRADEAILEMKELGENVFYGG